MVILGRRGGWVAGAALVLLSGCATAVVPSPPKDMVWPAPPEPARIRYVDSLWRTDQFGPKQRSWVKDIALGSDDAGRGMAKPFAVTSDARGRVYVSDTGQSRVWVFDAAQKQVRFLGDSGPARLVTPSGLAVDGRGLVWVADTKLQRVFGFDETGKLALAIGTKDEFYSPAGLAVDTATGRLYVADSGRHKIRVYDTATAKFLFEFGKRGTEPGEFNFPAHLTIHGGELYVTDTMNFRVQVLALDGTYRRKYGEMGASLGQLARPKGVSVDSEGHVYVVDSAFNNFQIFNTDGQLLMFVGGLGYEAGEFYLPAGLHIDAHDRVYVVDQYNRRVQIFQYLAERPLPATDARTTK